MIPTLPTQRYMPGDRQFSQGLAKMRASYRLRAAERTLGNESVHTALRACRGRMMVYEGFVPQRGSTSVEAVAWYREQGAVPGYMNRSWRRHFAPAPITTNAQEIPCA